MTSHEESVQSAESAPRFRVVFNVPAEISVIVTGEDEDAAYDEAVRRVEAHLSTLAWPDGSGVAVQVSIDGVGADEVTEVSTPPESRTPDVTP